MRLFGIAKNSENNLTETLKDQRILFNRYTVDAHNQDSVQEIIHKYPKEALEYMEAKKIGKIGRMNRKRKYKEFTMTKKEEDTICRFQRDNTVAYIGKSVPQSCVDRAHVIPFSERYLFADKYDVPHYIMDIQTAEVCVGMSSTLHKQMELCNGRKPTFSINPLSETFEVFSNDSYEIGFLKQYGVVHGESVKYYNGRGGPEETHVLYNPIQKLFWLMHLCETYERHHS